MSKNTFTVSDDLVLIGRPDWNFVATATIREDYAEELQSLTWTENNGYLYSNKLNCYLHIYIMKKWYGEDYAKMKNAGCIVEHMDNNGYNCCIDNLTFLISDENKAKGMTVDKINARNHRYIALSLSRDFSTNLYQINIFFNCPAILSGHNRPAFAELADLLYEGDDYRIVINEARSILYDYEDKQIFDLQKLRCIDYHIEGAYGSPIQRKDYEDLVNRASNHACTLINKRYLRRGWSKGEQEHHIRLRETRPAIDTRDLSGMNHYDD